MQTTPVRMWCVKLKCYQTFEMVFTKSFHLLHICTTVLYISWHVVKWDGRPATKQPAWNQYKSHLVNQPMRNESSGKFRIVIEKVKLSLHIAAWLCFHNKSVICHVICLSSKITFKMHRLNSSTTHAATATKMNEGNQKSTPIWQDKLFHLCYSALDCSI